MLANCKECGKLFNKIVGDYCPVCLDNIDKYYSLVNNYIYENGPQHINTVSKDTGVKERWIMQFIQEGRIINSNIKYPCQQCGETITKGKICNKCSSKWEELKKEKEPEKKEVIKMYSKHSHSRDRRED